MSMYTWCAENENDLIVFKKLSYTDTDIYSYICGVISWVNYNEELEIIQVIDLYWHLTM